MILVCQILDTFRDKFACKLKITTISFDMYFCIKKIYLVIRVGTMCLFQSWVLYQMPESLRVLHRMLLFLALNFSGQRPLMLFLVSPSLRVIAPSAHTTTGTNLAFTFHILFSSSFIVCFQANNPSPAEVGRKLIRSSII